MRRVTGRAARASQEDLAEAATIAATDAASSNNAEAGPSRPRRRGTDNDDGDDSAMDVDTEDEHDDDEDEEMPAAASAPNLNVLPSGSMAGAGAGMATSASMPTITSGGGGMSAGAGGSMTGIIPGVNGMPPPPVPGGEDGDVDDELLPAMTDADFTAQQTFMSQSKDNLK